ATIHASALPEIGDTTATVTVQGAGSLGVQSGTTLSPGQSAAFAVTLSTAAPAGGLLVTLASTDASKVTIAPTTVTVPAGQKTPTTQPQVTGVDFGSANITATATLYTPASAPVQVRGTVNFSPATLTIRGITTQNLTL